MLCEDAPNCLCGSHNWKPGGACIGGMSQEWMHCNDCGRPICLLFAYSNGVAFQHRDQNGDINEFNSWLNNTLLVTLRAEGEKIEAARREVWQKAWSQYCQEHGLSPDTQRRDLSEDLKAASSDFCDSITGNQEYRRPPGFDMPPIPPNIPEKMHLRLLHQSLNEYVLIESAQSIGLELPPDPIRVHHDEYYLPILAELGITDFQLIPNEYCGATNEPWYQFCVADVTFKVGPRKRVTSISIEAPHGINVEKISALAKADDTTYYVDEGWQVWNTVRAKTSMCVHAWTEEKVREYLAILIAAAQEE